MQLIPFFVARERDLFFLSQPFFVQLWPSYLFVFETPVLRGPETKNIYCFKIALFRLNDAKSSLKRVEKTDRQKMKKKFDRIFFFLDLNMSDNLAV